MKLFALLTAAMLALSVAACSPSKGPTQFQDNPRQQGGSSE
jgi:predicted small lipoprotein YifL